MIMTAILSGEVAGNSVAGAEGGWEAGGMLSASEVESFVADGYVAIRGAVPAGTVRACRDVIWSELAKQGVAEHDPATWTQPVVRIPCPEGGPFADAGTQPVLWEAFDQLIGPGRWWRRPGVGGTIPVRFPGEGDPGDAGWHIEASYESDGHRQVNIRSRARGLLALYLFSDVDAGSAPTLLATGQAGDVFVCHPFLVHAASWPHRGRLPKLMAQPAVALHDQFPMSAPLSPVERAIAAVAGR